MKRRDLIAALSVVLIGLVSWIVISVSGRAEFTPSQKKSAHSLAFACRSYASDYNGQYPETRMQLDSEWGNELDILWSPGGGIEYGLRSGLTESSPASSILIYSMKPVRAAEHYVVYRGGSGAFVPWNAIEEEIETAGSQQYSGLKGLQPIGVRTKTCNLLINNEL